MSRFWKTPRAPHSSPHFQSTCGFRFFISKFSCSRETKHPSTNSSSFWIACYIPVGVKTRHAPGIHPPLVVLFSVVFPGEKNWLEQGWLVALVMMSMLPFMGIGAAPWNEEIVGGFMVVSEFCWRILVVGGVFVLFVGWFLLKGRIYQDFLGENFLMRNFSHPLAGQSDFKRCSVQVGLVACFCFLI